MTKVLIVEDDTILLSAYKTKLTFEGMEVDTAQDGEEALQKATKNVPDAILLDIMLPKMSGLDFLKKYDILKKHKNVKVVVFSNLAAPEAPKEAFELGALKYLPKSSSTPNYIVDVLKEVLAADKSPKKN